MCPTISTGDSGEFCAASVILGLPHSPGYPLYCLLGKIFTLIIPFGNLAYRVNLISVFFAVLTIVILAKIIEGLSNPSPDLRSPLPQPEVGYSSKGERIKVRDMLNIIVAGLIFCFSTTFWRSAVQTEVFTLNTFFVAVLVLILSRKPLTPPAGGEDIKFIYLTAFLFGLGLGNHHTLVFISPIILWKTIKTWKSIRGKLFYIILFFSLGFSVYLYLHIRSFKNPGLDWGNPETLHNLWRVISRKDYGTFALTVGEKLARSVPVTIKQIGRFLTTFNHQISVVSIIIGIFGWVVLFKERIQLAIMYFLVFVMSGIGFILLANIPFTAEVVGILERFYIIPLFFFVVCTGVGIIWLSKKIKYAGYAGITSIAFLLLPLFLIHQHFDECNFRNYYLTYDYGRNIFRTLKPESIFFMDGGDDTFYSMAYLTFAEKHRQDIELHDRGGLVFRNIYGSDFRSLTKQEKEERRITTEKSYLGKKPVFYSTFNKKVLPGAIIKQNGILYEAFDSDKLTVPDSWSGRPTWQFYSLRNVFSYEYRDYRSRALVPVYLFMHGLARFGLARGGNGLAPDSKGLLQYWTYAYDRWDEVGWLETNISLGLHEVAYQAFQENKLDLAKFYYDRILYLNKSDINALTNSGVIAEKQNNIKLAKELYLKVIEIKPDYTEAYYNLGVVYWREENWEKVVEMFSNVLRIDPNHQGAKQYLPQAIARLKETR
ncbi:MAG: hypothetical protein AUJ85_00185 [Elusimicrobia bacterium CG1_02_37_114]|nr:MAG: hypothetical protein AUJ85_00185 [Elusimicrobia bacterium CG1_02_37_114]